MSRRPSLKVLENDMSTAELPATMPAVVESSAQRLAWQRDIANAKDEHGLIGMQIDSIRRTASNSRAETDRIFDARITAANAARDREYSDIDKIETAGVTSLEARRADIDKLIVGYEAAMTATAG